MNERVKTVKSLEVPGPSVVQPQVLCKCQERKVFAVEHCLACRPEAQNHDLVFWSTVSISNQAQDMNHLRQAFNGNLLNHFLGCSLFTASLPQLSAATTALLAPALSEAQNL